MGLAHLALMGEPPLLRMKMHKNRPQLLVVGPLILNDNVRPNIADVVIRKQRDYEREMLPPAQYSSHTSPPDFELFPKLREPMCS